MHSSGFIWIALLLVAMAISSPALAQRSHARQDKTKTEKPSGEAAKPGASEENFDQWLTKLQSEKEEDRFYAVTKIAASGNAQAAELILKALKDKDWLVRGRAAQLIYQLPADRRASIFPSLRTAILDEHWFVRGSALLGMAEIFAMHESADLQFARDSFALLQAARLDREPFVRRQAARALAASGDARAIEFLAPLLTDENELTRWEAAMSLAALGDRRAVERLRAARELMPENSYPFSAALYQFGEREDFSALVAAIDKIEKVDPILRSRLIKSLCQSNDARALDPLLKLLKTSDGELQLEIIAALGRLRDARATEPLLTLLKEDNRELQLAAIAALAQAQDERAASPLIERLLAAQDREMGEALVNAIAAFERPETVDALFKARKDKQGKISPAISMVLERMGITVDKLSLAIKNGQGPSWQGARASAHWLAELGAHSSVEPLVGALSHPDGAVREQAARALAGFGDRAAIEPLLLLLEDPVPAVRLAAIETLKSLGVNGQTLGVRLKSPDWRVRADAANLAGRMGFNELTPTLISVVNDHEAGVRQESITALGRLKDNRAIDCLIAALDDENSRVRAASANALGNIGDERAASALVQSLASYDVALSALSADALIKLNAHNAAAALIATLSRRNWRARAQAARVLGHMGEPTSIQSLVGLLNDKAAPVRYYACQALGHLGESAIAPLIDALKKNDNNGNRYGIAQALVSIGAPVVDPLCVALNESATAAPVRITLATTLAEIGDGRAIDPMINALDDDRFQVRQSVSIALGHMGDAALNPLLEALKSKKLPKRRVGAAAALKLLGKPEAAPALIEALNDKDDQVRANAAAALAELGDMSAISALEQLAKNDRADTVRAAARVAINNIQTRESLPSNQH
jgi:HEAT repeat protein